MSREQGSKGEASEEAHWSVDLGTNDAYIQEMYALYLKDPSLVGATWMNYFEQFTPVDIVSATTKEPLALPESTTASQNGSHSNGTGAVSPLRQSIASEINQTLTSQGYYTGPADEASVQERVYRMISAFRGRGHFRANINPLTQGVMARPIVDDIQIDFYRYTPEQLEQSYNCSGFGLRHEMKLGDLIKELEEVYCGAIGFEFTHFLDQRERLWLQERIETRFHNGYQLNREQKLHRLRKIIEAETFESELHKKYVGHKRFSLQGIETVIPLLDTMLEEAAVEGVKKVIFGMAHRGRLNVLANILAKPLTEVFSEFEDQNIFTALGSGDVKYHMGFESTYTDINGRSINLHLAPNPSHLEFVNPVVEGMARAYQDLDLQSDRQAVLPVLLHGDAAFAGQGVVFETLNMSQVDGYFTGGTVHVILNNQVGFTTDPVDSRSSTYCTDMAKAVQAPIFHVNCEDVESACWAVKTALDFRNRYGRDVVIDLYGYRKYGHNEGDDPSFTQPVLYSEIKEKKTISSLYAATLREAGVITDEDKKFTDEYKARFEEAHTDIGDRQQIGEACAVYGKLKDPSPETGVPLDELHTIAKTLVEYPETFKVHPKVARILQKRVDTLDGGDGIDWGFAEALAFGSLVLDGVAIRLSGQDSERGTFSQRHLALNDHEGGEKYYPLKTLEDRNNGFFEVVNSTLSEAAVVGFEFGYSTVKEKSLVLWEAQFGDFANGAQVLVDQFISSSEAKWSQRAGVVMLLPHGYEGQGPEHSSARLERYLQLCAEGNMFVCYPTTGAQYFHMLRRHGLVTLQRPMIVMTPKSLLRLPEAGSSAEELVSGKFQPILPEVYGKKKEEKSAIFLSGKVYYDVMKALREHEIDLKKSNFVLCRVEQFYPLPEKEIASLLQAYKFSSYYWLQEEPKNMGGWQFIDGVFREEFGISLEYIGRPASASTATGSGKRHAVEQKKILDVVLDIITES